MQFKIQIVLVLIEQLETVVICLQISGQTTNDKTVVCLFCFQDSDLTLKYEKA